MLGQLRGAGAADKVELHFRDDGSHQGKDLFHEIAGGVDVGIVTVSPHVDEAVLFLRDVLGPEVVRVHGRLDDVHLQGGVEQAQHAPVFLCHGYYAIEPAAEGHFCLEPLEPLERRYRALQRVRLAPEPFPEGGVLDLVLLEDGHFAPQTWHKVCHLQVLALDDVEVVGGDGFTYSGAHLWRAELGGDLPGHEAQRADGWRVRIALHHRDPTAELL